MPNKKIIFRADGNAKIGLGHVYRCLALAEMVRDDFHCDFYIQNPSETLKNEILKSCHEIHVLEETTDLLNEANELPLERDAIVVLDGYYFDTDYQKAIKEKVAALVCIDDLANQHFVADAVINHNPLQPAKDYSLELYSRLYLGVQFALVRPVFFAQRDNRKEQSLDSAFICFGGSDYKNISITATEACLQAGISRITVVTGSSYPYLEEFSARFDKNPEVRHIASATPEEMANLISESSFAICPASTISYEVAAVGRPMIIGYYAENQRMNEQFFSREKCAYSIGDFTTTSIEELAKAIRKLPEMAGELIVTQRRLYTDSSPRLKKIFLKLAEEQHMEIRNAIPDDKELYFRWANDPETRNNAINRELIQWENHVDWFEKKLAASDSYLYVALMEGQPFGQVRFDASQEGYVISFSLDKAFRGSGLGDSLLAKCINEFTKDNPEASCLKALVWENNGASKKIFERLVFDRGEDVILDNRRFYTFQKAYDPDRK